MSTAFAITALPARFGTTGRPTVCTRQVNQHAHRAQTPQMHGPPAGHAASTTRRPGERKGFVEEMRFIAMRLHTKDQAPREGEQETSALPIDAWYPPKEDFMQFLVDSHCVYKFFETELAHPSTTHPIFSRFVDNGLERLDALEKDMTYLNGMGISTPEPTAAATSYITYMRNLLENKPESLLCHWYNYYFAHSAGGRMIGRLMQDRLFAGRSFAFYEWETDVKVILSKVRVIIDDVADAWPREVKDDCLKETGLAFGYSGTVLQNLAKAD